MVIYPRSVVEFVRTILAFFDVFFYDTTCQMTGGPAKGLTVIVTGPTSGIGTETARAFVLRGANVVLACRSVERGEALKQTLLADAAKAGARTEASVEVWKLDVSSLESVRSFAKRWEAENRPLHILVNNAGIFSMGLALELTPEGFETHMATNHLGPLLLSLLMLPSLRRGAEAGEFGARIVQVSSSTLTLVRGVDLSDPHLQRQPPFGVFLLGAFAYGQSKLAQVMCVREMRQRLAAIPGNKVQVLALHPGMVLTEVVRTLPPLIQRLYKIILGTILLTPAQGARATMYAATSPTAPAEVEATGGYLNSNAKPAQPSVEARDPKACRAVWQWSLDTIKLPPELDLPDPKGD